MRIQIYDYQYIAKRILRGDLLNKGICMSEERKEKVYSDVFIANYSAVLTCFEMLKHPEVNHATNKLLVVQPFWLDTVDESRLDSTWGQNVEEFPNLISDLLKELNPGIEHQERVTFRQVKALREACIERIEASGEFTVMRGKAETIVASEDGKQLALKQDNGSEVIVGLAEDAKLFNFSQIARPCDIPEVPSQTDVYKYPRGEEPKKALVLGAGLSAVWFLEQTAATTEAKICVRNAHSKPPPSIARNKGKSITIEDCIKLDTVVLRTLKDIVLNSSSAFGEINENTVNWIKYAEEHGYDIESPDDNIVLVVDKDTQKPIAIAPTYVAYGYITDKSLTESAENIEMFQPDTLQKDKAKHFFAPKNIPGDAGFARYLYLKKEYLADRFSALDIDIEALVIIESEKELLQEAFKVPADFINCLCDQITELEDTPKDPQEYIKEQYATWAKAQSEDAKDIEPDFETLFQQRAQRRLQAKAVSEVKAEPEPMVPAPTREEQKNKWQRLASISTEHNKTAMRGRSKSVTDNFFRPTSEKTTSTSTDGRARSRSFSDLKSAFKESIQLANQSSDNALVGAISNDGIPAQEDIRPKFTL